MVLLDLMLPEVDGFINALLYVTVMYRNVSG